MAFALLVARDARLATDNEGVTMHGDVDNPDLDARQLKAHLVAGGRGRSVRLRRKPLGHPVSGPLQRPLNAWRPTRRVGSLDYAVLRLEPCAPHAGSRERCNRPPPVTPTSVKSTI